jgi:cyclic beta-1,2-glucan synthetase
VWSAGYQPCAGQPGSYEVSFTEDRAEIIRADGDVVSTLEVQVSPEDDAEVRLLSLTNGSLREREIEVTSYAELVLGSQAADLAHPAFSKMFVRTEFLFNEPVNLIFFVHPGPKGSEENQFTPLGAGVIKLIFERIYCHIT